MLRAALGALEAAGVTVTAAAPAIQSSPIGPSQRRYANSAALVETALEPPALLALTQRIERQFGRRAGGQRWATRVLDLDLVLWSGGAFAAPGLVIPHPLFRQRGFVLGPAAILAPRWRDPVSGLTLRQLAARLGHRR